MSMKKICAFLLFTPVYAEILIVQKKDSQFEALSETLSAEDADKITNILFKYQWPMCTMNTKLSNNEKNELLTPNKPAAEAAFITKKLHAFNPNYYAFWVPTTFYELVCLHTLFQENPSTVFLTKNATTPFMKAVNTMPAVLKGTKVNLIDDSWHNILTTIINSDYRAQKINSFSPYKTINDHFYKTYRAYFSINILVAQRLFADNTKLREHIDSENIYETVKSIIDPKSPFIKEIQENYTSNWINFFPYPFTYPIGGRFNFSIELNIAYIRQALEIEYSANDQNKGLLFRGTKLFKEQATDKDILVSPLHKPLGKITKVTPSDAYSISFGNSLFAGCLADAGATAYKYLSDTITTQTVAGYTIFIDKLSYIDSLDDNIFLISPLAYIASLFTYGEMFHSRSKAVLRPKKRTRIIGYAGGEVIDNNSLFLITRDPREHASAIAKYFVDNGRVIFREHNNTSDKTVIEKKLLEENIFDNINLFRKYIESAQKISMFIHKKVAPKLSKKKLVNLAESLEALAKSTAAGDINASHYRHPPAKTGNILIDNANLAQYMELMTNEELLVLIRNQPAFKDIKDGPIFALIQGLNDANRRGIRLPGAVMFEFAEGDWQLFKQLERITKIMESNHLKALMLYETLNAIYWDLWEGTPPKPKDPLSIS